MDDEALKKAVDNATDEKEAKRLKRWVPGIACCTSMVYAMFSDSYRRTRYAIFVEHSAGNFLW